MANQLPKNNYMQLLLDWFHQEVQKIDKN